MKLIPKIFLSIMGGIDIAFYIVTPIIIGVLWLNLAGYDLGTMILFSACLFSTLFRAIKIGFLKKNE